MRRLNFQRYVEVLIWCWVATLTLALGWITAEKIWQPVVEPWWLTVAASLGLGAVAAAVICFVTRPSKVDAALALDRAFGLKERISTTLTLPDEVRETPAGAALISDATSRVQMIEVGEKFNFVVPRTAWLPIVPAVLAILVASYVKVDRTVAAEPKSQPSTKEREQVKTTTKVFQPKLEEQKKQAEEKGFAEAEKLLAELTKATKDMGEKQDVDQKKALSKTNELQDAIKERREKLASTEALQKQLDKLKATAEKGPADKFNESLKKGDFKKAADEMSKMMDQLKSGKMTEAEKKALEKQLAQMKEQLDKLTNVAEKKKQLEEQLKKAGMPEEQIKKELAKLDEQAKQMEQLKELADKIAKAAEAMQQNDLDKALEQMQLSKADLQKMMDELAEMEMLDKALDQLAEMKNAMVCKNCVGAG
jgi:chemotaxis protein histidine kinase CheA